MLCQRHRRGEISGQVLCLHHILRVGDRGIVTARIMATPAVASAGALPLLGRVDPKEVGELHLILRRFLAEEDGDKVDNQILPLREKADGDRSRLGIRVLHVTVGGDLEADGDRSRLRIRVLHVTVGGDLEADGDRSRLRIRVLQGTVGGGLEENRLHHQDHMSWDQAVAVTLAKRLDPAEAGGLLRPPFRVMPRGDHPAVGEMVIGPMIGNKFAGATSVALEATGEIIARLPGAVTVGVTLVLIGGCTTMLVEATKIEVMTGGRPLLMKAEVRNVIVKKAIGDAAAADKIIDLTKSQEAARTTPNVGVLIPSLTHQLKRCLLQLPRLAAVEARTRPSQHG